MTTIGLAVATVCALGGPVVHLQRLRGGDQSLQPTSPLDNHAAEHRPLDAHAVHAVHAAARESHKHRVREADHGLVRGICFSLTANSLAASLFGAALAQLGEQRLLPTLGAHFVLSLLVWGFVYLLTGFLPMGWLSGSKPLVEGFHPKFAHPLSA